MKLHSVDPNIITVLDRIKNEEINLQPDFQRGEVWSLLKKKRLIDSILRNWYVPPIHLIELNSYLHEVLDGQQRLVAIKAFFNNEFAIDGNIEPFEQEIYELDGKRFDELSDVAKRKFLGFTLRFINITDYKPEEPSELFFRLNQPTNLTSAEQRNAYYGPARDQIKELVNTLKTSAINRDILGFTNSRMAYDDIVARLAFTLESGTLRRKITSQDIADKYRSKNSFSSDAKYWTGKAINTFSEVSMNFPSKIKFSKATLYSWLCFIVKLAKDNTLADNKEISEFIFLFEQSRNIVKGGAAVKLFLDFGINENLLLLFNQKASSGSYDASSILTRDLILWLAFYQKFNGKNMGSYSYLSKNSVFKNLLQEQSYLSGKLEEFILMSNWGAEI